jgi:transcriptional regulator with XRE-family HTH domain
LERRFRKGVLRMRKDGSSTTSNDNDLEKFETKLKLLAKAGEMSYLVSEKEIEELSNECAGLILPPELEEKYLSSMKMAYENLAIDNVRRRLYGQVKVFGRHIQYIRKEAGLSLGRVAERLGKSEDFLQKLESGQLNPLQVAKETISDIMEIFKINLKELTSTIQMFLVLAPMVETAHVHARADAKMKEEDKIEDISMAMEDLMYGASKKDARKVPIPEEFLKNITEELQRRGRTDLI